MTSITAHTHFAQDLIDLGELSDGLIGLSLLDGRAPVLVVSYPGGSAEIGCPLARAAVLVSAANKADLVSLMDAPDTLPGLSGPWSGPRPDLAPESVRGLVAAALA